jgi:hypothetical protein
VAVVTSHRAKPSTVYDRVAADLHIDPAALAAEIEKAIVQPLRRQGGRR